MRLIDKPGFNILRFNKNNYYSLELKLEIFNKILIDGKTIIGTTIEYGLASDGLTCTKRMMCYSSDKERYYE